MNNLPDIREIHIPDGVSVFPLAYGWWIILGSCIFFVLFIKFVLWGIKKSKKHYALNNLKKINEDMPVNAAIQVSELLRRICNLKFKEARSLYGEDWIKFLNDHTSYKISGDAAKLLIYAPFMNKKNSSYDAKTALEVKEFCRYWIGANL